MHYLLPRQSIHGIRCPVILPHAAPERVMLKRHIVARLAVGVGAGHFIVEVPGVAVTARVGHEVTFGIVTQTSGVPASADVGEFVGVAVGAGFRNGFICEAAPVADGTQRPGLILVAIGSIQLVRRSSLSYPVAPVEKP